MILKMNEDYEKRKRRYILEIDDDDLKKMDLTEHDNLILRDCEGKDRTISDKLIGLEVIARAIERGQS